jgi:hypothetical protein
MVAIRLRVRYDHRATPRRVLVLVVLAVGLLATLTLNRAHATVPTSPSSPSSTPGMRQFYLSMTAVNGNQAATACAEGYHFASMWEITDPSNLKYNRRLGQTSPDSGAGPPSQLVEDGSSIPAQGWVRTGYESSTEAVAGQGNCGTWRSDSRAHSGTVVHLSSDWAGGAQDVGVWNAAARACDRSVRVWCVQDQVPGGFSVFLPLVVRNESAQ